MGLTKTGLLLSWAAACFAFAGYILLEARKQRGTLESAALGAHIKDDFWAVCNAGSACHDELRAANGSLSSMWPGLDAEMRDRRLKTEEQRLALNRNQPATLKKFTPLGYEVTKVPPELFEDIRQWHSGYLKEQAPVVEAWLPDNTYVNHWQSPTYMARAPRELAQHVMKSLKPVMEAWSGLELVPTACYGIRHYMNGSVLGMHVDRVDTHVISGIINVEQKDVEQDWPLHLWDHSGTTRELVISPGDLVLYESATTVHGRPTRFCGADFANIFVHFRPAGGWPQGA